MTEAQLNDLPEIRQAEVRAALTAVETAEAPVPASAFRALMDPMLRAVLERCLAEQGRILMRTGQSFLSGYADTVSERLAVAGVGLLRQEEQAVLTLVILHGIAIPRAAGRLRSQSWTDAEPVPRSLLVRSQIPDSKIGAALQRLRDAGILTWGPRRTVVPGPQFHRLSPAVTERLWENLILLAEPHGIMAEVIQRRRNRAKEAS
ncbi:hypothetical protein [Micromonospora zamorensis]|uniref:hypothetical protein n=1 Tax=Micromonospora zamorensis TaxID=709883 RepID=UPI002E18894C